MRSPSYIEVPLAKTTVLLDVEVMLVSRMSLLLESEVPLASMIQNMAVTGGLASTVHATATFRSPTYAAVGEQLIFGASIANEIHPTANK